jgi:hypothetical protein
MKTVLATLEQWQARMKKKVEEKNMVNAAHYKPTAQLSKISQRGSNSLKSPFIVLMRHDCW